MDLAVAEPALVQTQVDRQQSEYNDLEFVSRYRYFDLFVWRHHSRVFVFVFRRREEMALAFARVSGGEFGDATSGATRSGLDYPVSAAVDALSRIEEQHRLGQAESDVLRALRALDEESSAVVAVVAPPGADGAWNQLINHELRHGLFYVEPDFRKYVLTFWANLPDEVREIVAELLSNWGYDSSNEQKMANEFHAYLFDTELAPFFQARLVKIGIEIEQLRSMFRSGALSIDSSKAFAALWQYRETEDHGPNLRKLGSPLD